MVLWRRWTKKEKTLLDEECSESLDVYVFKLLIQ